jgi:hypothetical protein
MNCKIAKCRIATLLIAGTAALSLTTGAQAQTTVYPTNVVNVAAAANGGRVLGATSTFEDSTDWKADNLIDGQVYDPVKNTGSFGWSSNKYDPIKMDAVTFGFADGETKRIGKIVLNPSTPLAPERWAKDVEIQVSTQSAEGPYRTAGIVTMRREAKPQTFLILPVEAKYVRLVFRSNQGSDRAVALGEVEMYEAISTADPTGQLIASMEQAIAELKQYRELEVRRRNSGTMAQNPETENLQNVDGEQTAISGATLQLIQMAVPDERAMFPVSNVNIAAAKNGGKIMFYSSLFSGDAAFSATNLIDGKLFNPRDPQAANSSAGWASEGFVPGREFVTIGFGDDRTHLIGKVVLNPASNQSPLRWARRVEIQVTTGSAKDGPWKTVETVNLRPDPVNQEFLIEPAEAKYVRFIFQANGPEDIHLPGITPGVNSDRAVSLGEIELYEATAATDALDAVIGRFENILLNMKKVYSEKMKTTGTATIPKTPVSVL